MSRKKLDIKSKYKDVSFSYKRVPSKFESITDDAIRKTKKYSLNSVRESYPGYPAPALKAMIMSVAGDFNNLYALLSGNYSSRKNKLDLAYANGYAKLQKDVDNFNLLIQNHNAAYDRYNEVSKELLNTELANNLLYDEARVAKMANKLKELEP